MSSVAAQSLWTACPFHPIHRRAGLRRTSLRWRRPCWWEPPRRTGPADGGRLESPRRVSVCSACAVAGATGSDRRLVLGRRVPRCRSRRGRRTRDRRGPCFGRQLASVSRLGLVLPPFSSVVVRRGPSSGPSGPRRAGSSSASSSVRRRCPPTRAPTVAPLVCAASADRGRAPTSANQTTPTMAFRPMPGPVPVTTPRQPPAQRPIHRPDRRMPQRSCICLRRAPRVAGRFRETSRPSGAARRARVRPHRQRRRARQRRREHVGDGGELVARPVSPPRAISAASIACQPAASTTSGLRSRTSLSRPPDLRDGLGQTHRRCSRRRGCAPSRPRMTCWCR